MRLATLFGVHLRANVFFVLVLGLLAFFERLPEALVLFGTVLLHELAHAVTAYVHGLTVKEIELLPFGGVARIDNLLEVDPSVEMRVAIAGPMTNGVLALLGWALVYLGIGPGAVIRHFITVNLLLGGFNLLPALPLDGGRIYRSLLTRRLGYWQATATATRVAKVAAVLLLIFGLAGLVAGIVSFTVMGLGLLIFITADKEQSLSTYVLMRYLTNRRVELGTDGWMEVEQLVAGHNTAIKLIVRRLVPKRYHIVWVVDPQGHVVGVVSEAQIIDTLFTLGIETPIGRLVTSALPNVCGGPKTGSD